MIFLSIIITYHYHFLRIITALFIQLALKCLIFVCNIRRDKSRETNTSPYCIINQNTQERNYSPLRIYLILSLRTLSSPSVMLLTSNSLGLWDSFSYLDIHSHYPINPSARVMQRVSALIRSSPGWRNCSGMQGRSNPV